MKILLLKKRQKKIDMLHILQEIVLNCDLEFTGKKATLFDRFCEIFEDITLLEN